MPQSGEAAIVIARLGERPDARRRQAVVPPRRPSVPMRLLLVLPGRFHVPIALESTESWLHCAARQPGGVDDVEAVFKTIGNGLEDTDRGDAEATHGSVDLLHSLARSEGKS
jgi:hypothetical protein